jgi:hypothetical protein
MLYVLVQALQEGTTSHKKIKKYVRLVTFYLLQIICGGQQPTGATWTSRTEQKEHVLVLVYYNICTYYVCVWLIAAQDFRPC